MSPLTSLGIETKDNLRHDRTLRKYLAYALAARASRGKQPQECGRAIVKLCRAARIAGSESQMMGLEQSIRQRIATLAGRPVDWSEFEGQYKRDRIETAVVLKPYLGPQERGVVFISFEYQWTRLAQLSNLDEFSRRYALVLSPSWSPPHGIETCLFPVLYPGRIVSLISHTDDLRILPRLSSKYIPVPLYASSWVHPDLYRSVPFADKDIDLVMVANFSEYKRHFALFRALRDMPRSTRVVLLGRQLGARTSVVLRREAEAYGVADHFELMENASDEVLSATIARAKTSIILSRQEGSCVAVVESMFADTPVGLYADARIGSSAFINSSTGRFLNHDKLGRQLLEFIAAAGQYSPRRWVLENGIHCFGSTNILNEALKREALAAGETWTQDIAVHHWRPNPELVFPADQARLQPAFEDIESRFGLHFGQKPAKK
jgi:glycosyltransferase involved in cell wall biosynthesis